MVNFTVNGKEYSYEPAEKDKLCLLDYLRDTLQLTGTKRGCDERICNACTVLVDGKATRACGLQMAKMDGKSVVTIEGIGTPDNLHPVQKAFIEYNAVQCGFCTPGLIMAVIGLLKQNNNPTEEEIKQGLKLNLCRCGTHPRVIKATLSAAAVLRGETPEPYKPLDLSAPGSMIGKSRQRIDLVDKVTGTTKFYADYHFDNTLYGKAVYSEYPTAKILSIDTSPAMEIPGVVYVMTAKDIPEGGSNRFGVLAQDQYVFCTKKTRFIGDIVAVVLAETEAIAEEGAKAVKIEWEEIPGVFSIEDAKKPDAPIIPDKETTPFWMGYVAAEKGNLCKEVFMHRGDIDEGFSKCDIIVEETFVTKPQEHAWIEPDGAISNVEPDGRVAVYSPNQSPFADRDCIARVAGLPPEGVHIVHIPCGGAFGGKTEVTTHPYVLLGSMITGRPVRMVNRRKDSLKTHPKRHPYTMTYKVGCTKEGKIMAMDCHVEVDGGAYFSWTPRVVEQGISYASGPYYIPHFNFELEAWYTNNMVKGAFRGFGAIQTHFGAECIIDMLAKKAGIDPITFREINGLRLGMPMSTGQILDGRLGISYLDTLKKAREIVDYKLKPIMNAERARGALVGIGVASGWRSVAGGLGPEENAGATFRLREDGKVDYEVACTEMGQGSHTSLEQLAYDVTGVDIDDFVIVAGDTDVVPFGGGVMASRGLFLWGHATIDAGKKFRAKLLDAAGGELGLDAGTLDIKDSKIVDKDSGDVLMTLKDLAKKHAGIVHMTDWHLPKSNPVAVNTNEDHAVPDHDYFPHQSVAYNTTLSMVKVDPETGKVRTMYLCAICDGGTIVNPDLAMTQIESGLIMGMGYGVTEDFVIENGMNKVNTLGKVKMPRFDDLPDELEVVFVKSNDPAGPMGAKGVAEISVLTPSPAICNGIEDAVGVRLTHLPVNGNAEKLKAQSDEAITSIPQPVKETVAASSSASAKNTQ